MEKNIKLEARVLDCKLYKDQEHLVTIGLSRPIKCIDVKNNCPISIDKFDLSMRVTVSVNGVQHGISTPFIHGTEDYLDLWQYSDISELLPNEGVLDKNFMSMVTEYMRVHNIPGLLYSVNDVGNRCIYNVLKSKIAELELKGTIKTDVIGRDITYEITKYYIILTNKFIGTMKFNKLHNESYDAFIARSCDEYGYRWNTKAYGKYVTVLDERKTE